MKVKQQLLLYPLGMLTEGLRGSDDDDACVRLESGGKKSEQSPERAEAALFTL